MYNNMVMHWLNTKIMWLAYAALIWGIYVYPRIFLPVYFACAIYLVSLCLWAHIQKRKSKGYRLKVTFLLPCESWLYRLLARRKGVAMPAGKVIELHLNPKKTYDCEDCEEAKEKFRSDLEDDLRLVKQLTDKGVLGSNPVVVLNTFNRYWLDRAEEILGAKRYPGTVLIKSTCNSYKPGKHKKVFKRMFPNCTLAKPGRDSPEKWDLVIYKKAEKGEAYA